MALACALAIPHARADDPPPLRLRASLGGGLVLSADQRSRLSFDLPMTDAQLRGGWLVTDFLVLEAALTGGMFFSGDDTPGGLLDLSLGAEARMDTGLARPWLSFLMGAGVTGDLVRPVMRIAVGVDLLVSDELTLGPAITYGHVFQEDGPGFTDDAQFLSLAVTLTYRPAPARPAPPPPPPPPPPRVRRRPPRPPPPLPPPQSTVDLVTLIDEATGTQPRELLVPVLFTFDSTELVACSVPSLHALREHLVAHPEIRVLEIEGNADGSGSDEYNDALSLRRAEAIRDWLVARGIEPERLHVAARGEHAPVETNDDDAGREQNRRARFRVLVEER